MYDLNRKVRLVNSTEYPLNNKFEFMGFICGMVSQDNDLEYVYFDNFMVLANMTIDDLEGAILKLDEIGNQFDVKFIATVSATRDQISSKIEKFVTTEL